MFEVFANPGFLAAGGALVSSPIIIHLINRMRFKRLRWAAMEFLLKAQKRTRKRLIIEQILLLLLRCFLVALVAFLVSRFLGFSFAGPENKEGLYVILLDDTLSMNDKGKDNQGKPLPAAFDRAREQIKNIVKDIGKNTTKDRVAIISLSQLHIEKGSYEITEYTGVGETDKQAEIQAALNALKVSNLHVDLAEGLEKARQLLAANPASRLHLFVISDFRQIDWGKKGSEDNKQAGADNKQAGADNKQGGGTIYNKLEDLAKLGVVPKFRDVTLPKRKDLSKDAPSANENLAIVEFTAGARVIGRNMPVTFNVKVANFGTKDRFVHLAVFNEYEGKEMLEVDFATAMPLLVKHGNTAEAKFEKRFDPILLPGESYFANISVRMENHPDRKALEEDGLADDNIRYATVEVRQKVPILIIDGNKADGRKPPDGDSFFIHTGLYSVPGASYEVEYGDILVGGGLAARALERADLGRFPTIFMLNVQSLTPKQTENLEKFVADGGGVAFFLGDKVDPDFYNKHLYKDGKGVFPVPLRGVKVGDYYPPKGVKELDLKEILVRDEKYGDDKDKFPIFGPVFAEKGSQQRFLLSDLPIRRYFQVPRGEWKKDPLFETQELATLPNDKPGDKFTKEVNVILYGPEVKEQEKDKEGKEKKREGGLFAILKKDKYDAYRKGLKRHQDIVRAVIDPNPIKPFKAYHLALALDDLLTDQGISDRREDRPNLKEFWDLADPDIVNLREEIKQLRDETKYGDPFVVMRKFGRKGGASAGQVVAVMSTAGKEWNDWGGGSPGSYLYEPFIFELQHHLTTQSSETNHTVGQSRSLEIDKEQFAKEGQLKMVRTYFQPMKEEKDSGLKPTEKFGVPQNNRLTFTWDKTLEPGLYVTKLYEVGKEKKIDGSDNALASWGDVFNIQAEIEGKLERVSMRMVDESSPKAVKEQGLTIESGTVDPKEVSNRPTDFSESPWLFLIFLFVLVAEQALAVHLSFHLKGGEAELHAPKSGHVTPSQAA